MANLSPREQEMLAALKGAVTLFQGGCLTEKSANAVKSAILDIISKVEPRRWVVEFLNDPQNYTLTGLRIKPTDDFKPDLFVIREVKPITKQQVLEAWCGFTGRPMGVNTIPEGSLFILKHFGIEVED